MNRTGRYKMRYRNFPDLFICFFTIILVGANSAGEDTKPGPTAVLDALKGVVEKPSFSYDSSGGLASNEFRVAQKQGPSILPELAQRLAETKDISVIHLYIVLFRQAAAFFPFPYSDQSIVVDGVDYYEADTNGLPFLKRKLHSSGEDPFQERDQLLVWWGKLNKENPFEERITAMRVLAGKLSADGSDMTGADYRAFYRANCNYGIFNLPVYITLIRKDNNPLAFMEFLCVSSHLVYKELKLPANVVERIKIITAAYPTHEARVTLVEKWWAENAVKYEGLPALAKAIDQAVKN